MKLRRLLSLVLLFSLEIVLLKGSVVPPGDQLERLRAFTRAIEYDYIEWTINALGIKLGQIALGTYRYLPPNYDRQVVLDYLDLVGQIWRIEGQTLEIFSSPIIPDPQAASASLRQEMSDLKARLALLQPLAEAVLQSQISTIVASLGLSLAGQPLPPVLYHSTSPPDALIVSPRNAIRQDANISISPGLSVEQHAALEESVDRTMDVSSLVVGIGGIGLYPTMVYETTDINVLAEVVAHEWTHNYLTLRPLGLNYETNPDLRTMNETAASIAGKEIGQALVARYYPEFLPAPPAPAAPTSPSTPNEPVEPVGFDFRLEMRQTRVTVDQLLAEGKIEEAEAYMDARQRIFWDNGYLIRKINQAYFAFYGAYADEPGGAAGEDPVGGAVRALRLQSTDLAGFLKQISWMWSYRQLEQAVQP